MSTEKRYRKVDDSFSIKDVGSTLLDHLAKGLYPEAEVLREYIQNAIDAHRIWKYENNTEPEGPIQVEVRGDRISVIDYGIGMSEEEVRKVKSIAITSKMDTEMSLTGHKGVGIWAGLSYFDTLILDTTKRGFSEGYRLTIHFRRIVDSINDRTNIGEVMDGNYLIEVYDEDLDKHSTSVTLVNPKRTSMLFASSEEIRAAISRICPCEIDPNFTLYQRVKDWYDQQNFEVYPIVVDGSPVYRLYPSSVENFKTFSITINDLVVAQGWQALHNISEKLVPTHGELIGFRLIESGFTLGGDNPYNSPNLPGYAGLNSAVISYIGWHIGEIHIVSNTLRPNLQRNYLEESEVSRQFIQKLRDYYAKLEQPTRVIADKRKTAKKIKSDALNSIKIYQGYDNQITQILNQNVFVDFTLSDIAILTDIQQMLVNEEEKSSQTMDAKEAKIYAHLKEKDVKDFRKKLLKKLEIWLVSETQKKAKSNQALSEDSTWPNPQHDESKIESKPSESGTMIPIDSVTTNDKNRKEKTDNSASLLSSDLSNGYAKESFPENSRTEDNTTKDPPPSAAEIFYEEVLNSEDTELESTERGTFSSSTSRKIPVVIVLGFLEHILSEELPMDSDVKSVILSKLTEKIDRVLTNVE